MRNEGGGFAAIDDEVAAVLTFVISHTTFFSAQDDEMRRTTPAKGISTLSNQCQGLVRFFALRRIKPHTPPLVRAPGLKGSKEIPYDQC